MLFIISTLQDSPRRWRLQRELGRSAAARGGEGRRRGAALEVDARHVVEEVGVGADGAR